MTESSRFEEILRGKPTLFEKVVRREHDDGRWRPWPPGDSLSSRRLALDRPKLARERTRRMMAGQDAFAASDRQKLTPRPWSSEVSQVIG
jgi:hypothetical protein